MAPKPSAYVAAGQPLSDLQRLDGQAIEIEKLTTTFQNLKQKIEKKHNLRVPENLKLPDVIKGLDQTRGQSLQLDKFALRIKEKEDTLDRLDHDIALCLDTAADHNAFQRTARATEVIKSKTKACTSFIIEAKKYIDDNDRQRLLNTLGAERGMATQRSIRPFGDPDEKEMYEVLRGSEHEDLNMSKEEWNIDEVYQAALVWHGETRRVDNIREQAEVAVGMNKKKVEEMRLEKNNAQADLETERITFEETVGEKDNQIRGLEERLQNEVRRRLI